MSEIYKVRIQPFRLTVSEVGSTAKFRVLTERFKASLFLTKNVSKFIEKMRNH